VIATRGFASCDSIALNASFFNTDHGAPHLLHRFQSNDEGAIVPAD
jgi:hypothetical protein